MHILHVASECYPVAKAGGLGDVMGALPKYQNQLGAFSQVVMPMYRLPFLFKNDWDLVHEGSTFIGGKSFNYSVIKERTNKLGFELYLLDIYGILDRENIYGYTDDYYRFLSFQIAVLDWVNTWEVLPSIIHCHDHPTGLIPFMKNYCFVFDRLKHIPCVFTIHNAEYSGAFSKSNDYLLPAYDGRNYGLIEWSNAVHPLASAIRCAHAVTTVSQNYLWELQQSANGLESLFRQEAFKCFGILNGIDVHVWDPATDSYLEHHYDETTIEKGKKANKTDICEIFHLSSELPLMVFISRLVYEKSADLMPGALDLLMRRFSGRVNVIVLGSGDEGIAWQLRHLEHIHNYHIRAVIGYQEALSHRLYAAADFLIMPSRVEPCGLNQMYAMRYGTIPIVRRVGGLKDTVVDIGEPDGSGFGFMFMHASVDDIVYGISRAISFYESNPDGMMQIREKIMKFDHSWENSTQKYLNLYADLIQNHSNP